MPVIVIEGVDGSGKSTLAERIAEIARDMYKDVRLEHFGPPVYEPTSPLSYGAQEADQMLERVRSADFYDTFVVLDRFHWGSAAYGPIFRPDKTVGLYGSMSERDFDVMEYWLSMMGAVQVYVDADDDVLMSRMSGRGEDFLSADLEKRLEQVRRVRDNYLQLIDALEYRDRKKQRYYGRRATVGKLFKIQLENPDDTEYWAQKLVLEACASADRVDERLRGKAKTRNTVVTKDDIRSRAKSMKLNIEQHDWKVANEHDSE